jgi:hypothetical protein
MDPGVFKTPLLANAFNALLLGAFRFASIDSCDDCVFGVINYSVAQRTHEIGIRLAWVHNAAMCSSWSLVRAWSSR